MKLSKINQEILDLYKDVRDIETYEVKNDYNTRGGNWANNSHIVTNIKVYDWLEQSNVVNELNKLELHDFKEQILEEFNSDRLSAILDHTKEFEVNYAKEKIEDIVHIDNYFEKARAYNILYNNKQELPTSLEYYNRCSSKFAKFNKRKNNSYKDYLKFLQSKDEKGFKELSHLLNVDREVWQFGRSGGWLSICNADELEDKTFDLDLSSLNSDMTNAEFNVEFNYEIERYYTKKELVKLMKEFINNWNSKKESINYIIDIVQEQKDYFLDSAIGRLNTEISEFVYNLEIDKANVTISIKDGKVKTTLGVSIDKNEFTIKFNSIAPHIVTLEVGEIYKINKKVGNYLVEFAIGIENDVVVKAGCHRFSLNNLMEVLKY